MVSTAEFISTAETVFSSAEPEVSVYPEHEPSAEITAVAEASHTSAEPEVTSEFSAFPESSAEPEAVSELSFATSEPEGISEFNSVPEISPEPTISAEPEAVSEFSSVPEISAEPETVSEYSSVPEVTAGPGISAEPEAVSELTSVPEVSSEPEISAKPEVSVEPESVSEITFASSEPEVVSEVSSAAEITAGAANTPEPESGTSEPEVTSEAQSNPEVEPEVMGYAEPEGEGEPGPDWNITSTAFDQTYDAHIYLMLTLYAVFFCLSVIWLIAEIKSKKKLKQSALGICLQTVSCCFSAFRFISLMINPYSQTLDNTAFPAQVLFALGLPCLTTLVTLLLLVFIDTTRMVASDDAKRFQNPKVLACFVASHFMFTLVAEVMAVYIKGWRPVLLSCALVLLSWALCVMVGYIVVGTRIHKTLFRGEGAAQSHQERSGTTNMLRVLFGFAALGFCIIASYIYSIFGVFKLYKTQISFVEPWSWLILQTVLRLEEFTALILMLKLSSKPVKQLFSRFKFCKSRNTIQPIMSSSMRHVTAVKPTKLAQDGMTFHV